MSDEPDNLMLVYLRRLDAKMDQVIDIQGDHGRRLTGMEAALSSLAASEANHFANTMLRIDGLSDRITRVERRLDLREQA